MRREDIFMDLIGELDDNYIALAMSSPKRRAIVSETRKVTFVQPVEVENNVSKRELRLYYITRVLGMAAVTFLIVGAAVLLIMNWDKIVVRDPDMPPVVTTDVTTVTDPSIIDQTETGYIDAADWGITMEAVSADTDGVIIEIRQSGGSFTGQIKYGYGFTVEKYTNGEWVQEISQYGDYWEYELAPDGTNREYWTYGKKLDAGKYRIVKNFVDLRAPGDFDIASGYAEFEISGTNDIDRFEQVTDTSMPRPFPIEQDYDHMPFELQWNTKFIGIFGDSNRDGFIEWQQYLMTVTTPYTLYDNNCIAGAIKALGYTAEEIEEKFTQNNERWQEKLRSAEKDNNEGAIINCRNMIFSDEEINALISGDEAEIIRLFISDHSIWIKDKNYVISPWWLYYHTIEDYKAVGITPEMVKEKYPLYKQAFSEGDWKMTDEAWAAFDAKLQKYMGMTSDAEETDSNEKDSDRFEQITDTSMPDLITGHTDDDSYYNFEFPWKLELRGIPIELMRLVDESDTEKWFESIKPLNSGTPYRIDRGYSLYSYITGVGLSWDKAKPILERDFSADEISAMVSGNMELITKNSASEYTIVIGDCAYSPKWLYYHTTEDYKAVGITPGMVGDKLQQYQKLGLPEEMWKAFREKLVLYCTKDLYDESAVKATYLIETDNAEPFGDHAFEILENAFYGEWEIAEKHEPYEEKLSLTYSKDAFYHGMIVVSGICETDEIYAIMFSNGGAGGALVIEKSSPDVMYWTDAYPISADVYTISVGDNIPGTYINRKAEVPGLKSGELSELGKKKLFDIYGKKFEDSFNELLEKDKSEGIYFDGRTVYPTWKDIFRFGEATPYLGTLTDDEVRILMPYYYEDDSGNATELYAEMWFSKYYNGDWGSGTNVSITPDASGLKINGKPIPNNELEGFDLDALTGIVFAADNKTIKELNKFLYTINDKELVQQYKRAYVLRTVAFASDDVAATLVDDTGKVVAVSTGFTFESVMNAYLQVFKSEYVSDLFADLHFYRYGDELFCRDASMVIPDCHYELRSSGGEDRAVIAVMGYAKDKATGAKTDEIIYGIEAIFDKTSEGWKCSRFNPHSINQ